MPSTLWRAADSDVHSCAELHHVTELRRLYEAGVISPTAATRGLSAFSQLTASQGNRLTLRIERHHEIWDLETPEDFVAEYDHGVTRALVECRGAEDVFRVRINGSRAKLTVRMVPLAAVRVVVAAVEKRDVRSPTFAVFVGHGRSPEWQALTAHLRDQHHLDVVSYETLAQMGEPATAVLDRAAWATSVAVLVHSAEIRSTDGHWYPSANVVHETGFFSARFGASRAIVVRDDRCVALANVVGLTHLRYPKRNIRETFGDVVAAIQRLREVDDLSDGGNR